MSETEEGYEIKDFSGNIIAQLQPDKVNLVNQSYKWIYNKTPEFSMIELELTDGLEVPVRILLNFKPTFIGVEDFNEISPRLKTQTMFSGKSTNDPSGLIFYEAGAEAEEQEREEFYGLSGEQKYLSLFASGTNIGDAVKYNMPENAILLGDPTIRLETKSTSSLNYNSATGQQIFSGPGK